MTTLINIARTFLVIAVVGVAGVVTMTPKAQAYDMDCKVILCIAGGFPSGCSDAWRYMIKRITKRPKPLPPFGFCAMSDGTEYKAHNVGYRFLGRGPEAYDCPDNKKLFYAREQGDRGAWGNEVAFCYTKISQGYVGFGRDRQYTTIYENQSPANHVNFELKITIEPGTQHEFRSPLFRINTSTGYVSYRPI